MKDELMERLVVFARYQPVLFKQSGTQLIKSLQRINSSLLPKLFDAYKLNHLTNVNRFHQVWKRLSRRELQNPIEMIKAQVELYSARANEEWELKQEKIRQQQYVDTLRVVERQQQDYLHDYIEKNSLPKPKPKPRNVRGSGTSFIVHSNNKITKHLLHAKTKIDDLAERFGDVKSVFLLTTNMGISANESKIPSGMTRLLIILVDGEYKIGIVKSIQFSKLVVMVWKLQFHLLHDRESWDNPYSWKTMDIVHQGNSFADGGFVNEVFWTTKRVGMNDYDSKDKEYLHIAQCPDYCPYPSCKRVLTIYCEVPDDASERKKFLEEVPDTLKHKHAVPLDKAVGHLETKK